jgi:hypothetical protein
LGRFRHHRHARCRVHIAWLRDKFDENPKYPRDLQVVRGRGYRLSEDHLETAPRLLSLRRRGKVLMMVAAGLAIFVVICLLLSMVETPPAIGR